MSIAALRNPFEGDIPPVVGIWDNFESEHYRFYDVEVQCTDFLLGGAPKNPDTLLAWLKSRFDKEDDLRAKLLEHVRLQGIDVEQDATIEHVWEQLKSFGQEQHGNGFLQDDKGLFVPSRCVKSLLKEAANVRFAGEYWKSGRNAKGEPAGRAKLALSVIAERVYVEDNKTYVMRRDDKGDLKHITEPDGTYLHIGHPEDRFGNKVANLGYFDYCMQPILRFSLRVEPLIPDDDQIKAMLVTAQRLGLWGAHSMGFGQFRVTVFRQR